MLIERKDSLTVRKRSELSSKHGFRSLVVLIGLLFLVVLLSVLLGQRYISRDKISNLAYAHGFNSFGEGSVRAAVFEAPQNWLKSKNLQTLNIDIKFKDFQKLERKRKEAVNQGILIAGKDDFVPAEIRVGKETVKVKLRLKGDWVDHLKGKKWSFRIHVEGKNHIFGYRRFSIQHPSTRGYQGEKLFYDTLTQFDVLTPGYSFAQVKVNGLDIGVMAIEEHFSKELLEANQRKESVILKYDDTKVWASRKARRSIEEVLPLENHHNIPVDAFRTSKILASDRLSRDYAVAASLLIGFSQNEIAASEVFDVKLLAGFLAATELWGAAHGLGFNQRFYYNPLTARLEPIAFDMNVNENSYRVGQLLTAIANEQQKQILLDEAIYRAYVESLTMLIESVRSGELITLLKQKENGYLNDLHSEYFLLGRFPFNKIVERAEYLSKVLAHEPKNISELEAAYYQSQIYPQIVSAYKIERDGRHFLDIANLIPGVAELTAIQWISKDTQQVKNFDSTQLLETPLSLSATGLGTIANQNLIEYLPPEQIEELDLRIVSKMKGNSKKYYSIAETYYEGARKNPVSSFEDKSKSLGHKFLTKESEFQWSILPGEWEVTSNLVIPENVTLKMVKGTTLKFGKEVALISRGALLLNGTKNDPIELVPLDKDGPSWQGLVVLNALKLSVLDHVNVRQVSGVKKDGWELTGGITFYNSNVTIIDCNIYGSLTEDALNIVRSNFNLKNLNINGTYSDGIDIDFSKGKIQGGHWQNIGSKGGGDALDVSGSKVEVVGSRITGVSDKGISVGEASDIVAKKIVMNNVSIGAVSKDGSILELINSVITNHSNYALMSYIKKPEYGAGKLIAVNLDLNQSDNIAKSQAGSIILIDGIAVTTEEFEVDRLYDVLMKSDLKK